jgi:hypothetical protein
VKPGSKVDAQRAAIPPTAAATPAAPGASATAGTPATPTTLVPEQRTDANP